MCGTPQDAIFSFNKRNIHNTRYERDDSTIGKYLEELAVKAKETCD